MTRLEIITCAQGSGFCLEEIRAILPPDLDKWPHDQLLQALRRKVDEIELLEQRLAQSRHRLVALIEEINGTREGEDCEGKARRVLERMNQDGNSGAPASLPGRRTRTSRKGIPL